MPSAFSTNSDWKEDPLARRRGFVRGAAAIRDKRETLWIAQSFIATVVASNSAVLISTLDAAELAFRPFTILRTRGILHMSSDQQVAGETYGVSFGMAVVSDQASAIGITALPTPNTDAASDLWFLYESMINGFVFADATGFSTTEGEKVRFDSKAMRKVQEGEDVVSVIESPPISSGLLAISNFRMLIRRN